MSALAGYFDPGGDGRAADGCRRMLSDLRAYTAGRYGLWDRDRISLGCWSDDLLPEDQFGTQPIASDDQRLAIIFDGRVDNRTEVAAHLEVGSARLAETSDPDLVLGAWQRWGMGSLDRLVGDFAIAIWQEPGRRLTLARSPLSTRPLFYHRHGRSVAFASMPMAIAALPTVSKSLDFDAVAALASGAVYRPDPATLFQGIRKVLPGEVIEFREDEYRSIQSWNLDEIPVAQGGIQEFGDALSEAFGLAVSAQLRRRSGKIASHLSAGRDSSAVTATAALALAASGSELIGLTAAPRLGFSDGADGDWLVDESQFAAATARAHANVEHRICRPNGEAIEDWLDELHRHHFSPIMNLSNMPWSIQLTRAAADRGATVLLTGANGNFSISNGGDGYLIDLFREQGIGAWWRQASRLADMSPAHWLKLSHQLIAPWLPRPVYQLLRQISGRATPASDPLPMLATPLRDRAEAIRAEHFRDWRPPRSYRELVKQTLAGIDDAQKFPSALWGVDIRDPTSDRRVVELCLSLPASAMFAGDLDRPVYAAAFADRLPPQVLGNRRRGYQCADWFERFDAERIRGSFRRYLENPLVREVVDQQHVETVLDRWPRTGWQDSIVEPYRNQLLGTLAIASFIDTHFPR